MTSNSGPENNWVFGTHLGTLISLFRRQELAVLSLKKVVTYIRNLLWRLNSFILFHNDPLEPCNLSRKAIATYLAMFMKFQIHIVLSCVTRVWSTDWLHTLLIKEVSTFHHVVQNIVPLNRHQPTASFYKFTPHWSGAITLHHVVQNVAQRCYWKRQRAVAFYILH